MKKFFIGMTALALSVCLTACGTPEADNTMSTLSNQLDKTANTISSFNAISPSDVSILESETSQELYNDSQNTQHTIMNEQYYKTEILQKTAQIKNILSKDAKINNACSTALKDHILVLEKYTKAIESTKGEMENNANSIKSLKKNTAKNQEKIDAKLNRLACNSNLRSAYYENLINTLDKIENCIEIETNKTSDTTNNSAEKESEKTTNSTNKNNNENEKTSKQNQNNTPKPQQPRKTFPKNIDTYRPDNIDKNETDENVADTPIDTPTPLPNDATTYPNFPTNRNNIYNRYNRFAQNRNIDTYGPGYRNIDSYGGNDFYGGGYGMPYGNPYRYGNYGEYGRNFENGLGYGYGNNFYNSNNFNRAMSPYGNRINGANTPTTIPATTENAEPEQRLETYEEQQPIEEQTDATTDNNKIGAADESVKKTTINTSKDTTTKTTERAKTTVEKTTNTSTQSVKSETPENSTKTKPATENKKNKNQVEDLKIKSVSLSNDLLKTRKNHRKTTSGDEDPIVIAH